MNNADGGSSSGGSAAAAVPNLNDSISSPSVECPVCCEIFRTPKCLTCGHSVCADCCQKLITLLANSIACPVCRRVTIVPAGGLPTNFALQDLVQHYQARDCQKSYECAECGRLCTAEEAWVLDTKVNGDMIPRCFRCVILKHSSSGTASALPAALESVADTFKRYEGDLAKLKRHVETSTTEQREWADSVKQAALLLNARADDIVQVSRSLGKATLDDVDKLNEEFQSIVVQANSTTVPRSLGDMHALNESIQEMTSKLEGLSNARRRENDRTTVALNSLTIGLECLLSAVEEREDAEARGVEGAMDETQQQNDAAAGTSLFPPSPSRNIFSIPGSNRGRNGVPQVRARRRVSVVFRPATNRP